MFLDNLAVLRRSAAAGERRPTALVSRAGKALTTS
jgi:hypothetical protein